jgi:phage-related protein
MAAFPTLTRGPIYPLSPDGDLEDAALRSDFTAGYEQTRPKFTRARRSFGLSYRLEDADVATLRAFELTTLVNGSDAFVWTHPLRATSHTVRLTAPIKYGKSSFGLTDVSFTIREV